MVSHFYGTSDMTFWCVTGEGMYCSFDAIC